MNLLKIISFIAIVGLAAPNSTVNAETVYPSNPIKMVVGFPPGGGADLIARVVADRLGAKLGKAIVVLNKPGAGSSLGTSFVAKAPADGYTLLFATSSFTINPSLYASVEYDPVKDFIPISSLGTAPFCIVVKSDSPIISFAKLLAAAKAKPGSLTYGSGGIGSVGNLAAELIKSKTASNIVHVPYKGLSPAIAGLLGGDVDMVFSDLAIALPFIKSGKLRPLVVTSAARLPWLPDVPTVAESAIPGYEVVLWNGLFVPAGTPQEVVSRLNLAVRAIFSTADAALTERYTMLGELPPVNEDQKAFETFVKSDVTTWKKTITDAHITPSE